MYLHKKVYIGANYEHRNVKGACNITVEGKKIPIRFKRISYIEERVGYWRKANQIHDWFVKNVQKGEDDCKQYFVSLEKLKELLELCRKVLRSKKRASELLPTSAGFFFGGTEYDDSYFQDLKDTVKILNPLIKEIEAEAKNKVYSDVYYQSSW